MAGNSNFAANDFNAFFIMKRATLFIVLLFTAMPIFAFDEMEKQSTTNTIHNKYY